MRNERSDITGGGERAVYGLLRARGDTVTFAESCTGGLLAARLE